MQGQIQKATQEWASLFTNLPLQKWVNAAPRWVTVLLVILVAKAASDMTWLIFAPDESGSFANRRTVKTGQAMREQEYRLRMVADMHLFGEANRQVASNKAEPIAAKKTGLKLTLRGVFAVNSEDLAMALIADARGKEKVYKKEDTIFPGVKLYEIYADKVILERSGNFETLYFPEHDEKSSVRSPVSTSRKIQRAPVRTDGNIRTRNIRASKRIKDSLKMLNADPQKFMQEARIEPVFDESNQIKGYRFEHKDRRLVSALGLRKGDVIVEINGQSVRDPSALTSLFTQLGSMSQLSLSIERNGRRENLNITL